eukprot:973790-Prorocentrum_minimum.AAC.1
MHEVRVYSYDGPIRCRKRGYILMMDQSDAYVPLSITITHPRGRGTTNSPFVPPYRYVPAPS